jgi:opacity protein-like surface antigen
MKKIVLLFIFFVTIQVSAQDISNNAIGLRFGDDDGLGAEISYQKHLGSNNRLEVGLAWRNHKHFNAFKVTGTYQWVFDLQGLDGVNWYVGAGGGLGSWSVKSDYLGDGGTFLFIAGDIGIEYKFDIPLQLALDFRPELGFVDYNNDLGLDIALAVRYTF